MAMTMMHVFMFTDINVLNVVRLLGFLLFQYCAIGIIDNEIICFRLFCTFKIIIGRLNQSIRGICTHHKSCYFICDSWTSGLLFVLFKDIIHAVITIFMFTQPFAAKRTVAGL